MTDAASSWASDPNRPLPAAEGRLDLDLPAGRPSPQISPSGIGPIPGETVVQSSEARL